MEPADYSRPINAKKDDTTGFWYFTDRNHPLAGPSGRVALARHLVSGREGRWLRVDEIVIYADRNRDNFDPANLILVPRAQVPRGLFVNKVEMACAHCGETFYESPSHAHLRRFCSDACHQDGLRKFDVDREELHRLVWAMPTTAVAAKFGVSDKAVEKRCKLLGVDKPPRGYWARRAKEEADAKG